MGGRGHAGLREGWAREPWPDRQTEGGAGGGDGQRAARQSPALGDTPQAGSPRKSLSLTQTRQAAEAAGESPKHI